MDHLEHWKLREDFYPDEIACLIAGIDPLAKEDASREKLAEISFFLEEITSTYDGTYDEIRTDFRKGIKTFADIKGAQDGKISRHELEKIEFSVDAFLKQRTDLHLRDCSLRAILIMSNVKGKWVQSDFRGTYEEIKDLVFSSSEIRRWIKDKLIKSKFTFAPPQAEKQDGNGSPKAPHIRRSSIWNYVALAAPRIFHFAEPTDDIDSLPGLLEVRHVPALLLLAVQNITSAEKATEFLKENNTALQSIMGKLEASIGSGELQVYDNASFLLADINQLTIYKGGYLVRFDDVEKWSMSQGLQISASLPKDHKKAEKPSAVPGTTRPSKPQSKYDFSSNATDEDLGASKTKKSNAMNASMGPFRDRVRHFFKLDRWHVDEACYLLVGVLPENYPPLGFPKLDGSLIKEHERDSLVDQMSDIKELWESNDQHGEYAEPKYYIDWAIKKAIPVPWMEWAINSGHYSTKVEKVNIQKEVSGKSETSYLNIIGALLGLLLEKTDSDGKRYSQFSDQTALIQAIHDHFGDTGGLSESHIQKKFAAARKSLASK